MNCPRCSQPLIMPHKDDDPKGLCDHCRFMYYDMMPRIINEKEREEYKKTFEHFTI